MKSKTYTFLLIPVLFAIFLYGCGGGGGSAADDPPIAAATVGTTSCITASCHESTSQVVDDWLWGKHGNLDESPSFPIPDCSAVLCHDNLNDGIDLPNVDLTNPDFFARPVIGCESCHGGGEFHNVDLTMTPYPKSSYKLCGPCHGIRSPLMVGSDFDESNLHLGSLNDSVFDTVKTDEVVAKCSRCHSDEGAREHKMLNGDYNQLELAFTGQQTVAGPTAIECRTCHTPHSEEVPLLDEDELFAGSVQYNTCTGCHQLTYPMLDYNGDIEPRDGELMTDTQHSPLVNPLGDYGRMISDTHFDDPATAVVEGYAIDPYSETTCSACHNLHDGDNTIQNQWAGSAHSGFIADAKEAAITAGDDVFAAGVNEQTDSAGYAPAWTHYDWDSMSGGFSGNGRQDCQRCHTATGLKNYLTSPVFYDPAFNDFSHLENWPSGVNDSSGQNELLYCWGCHLNVGNGSFRNPGPISETYGTTGVTYPHVGHSDICLACHMGREIGDSVSTSTADFNNVSFINSHYLAAGPSLFGISGYQFQGLNYNPPEIYFHDSLGTQNEAALIGADIPEADEGMGPCVGCHMTTQEGHSLRPIKVNEAGTDFEDISTTCGYCHYDAREITFAYMEDKKTGFVSTLEVLEVALNQQGYYFVSKYPYFFNDDNGDGIVPTPGYTFDHDSNPVTPAIAEDESGNAVADWIPASLNQANQDNGKNTMGAAFNYNLLIHEPGGYAHNSFYNKRLMWDSIDWLDDFVINDSVLATISDYQINGLISSDISVAATNSLGIDRPGTDVPDRDPLLGTPAPVFIRR